MAGGTETVTVVVADAVGGGADEVRVLNSAVEALDVALAMRGAGARRVGVAVGEITREEVAAPRALISEASGLRDAAPPGSIVISDVVRHLLGTRRPVELKAAGVGGAWCWSPAGHAEGIPLPPSLLSVTRATPFVGRVMERARLRGAWDTARTGAQRVVAVAGEPGIGKTRLTAELAVEVHAEGATVLYGRADEDIGVPYKPFVEAINHYARYVAPTDLRAHLGEEGREIFRLLPGLAERLPDLGAPTRDDPDAERFLLLEAVAALTTRIAADTPLLLVLDDVHWADRATLQLAQHIARRPAPVLIVATYRDTEVGPRHPFSEVLAGWHRDGVVERVNLGPVPPADVPDFAAALPSLRDAGTAFWQNVHDRTGGNPFFIHEVLRHAVDVSVDDEGVPEGVDEIVARRVGRLSDAAIRVLGAAAVCGLEFDTAAVEAGVDVDVVDALDALEEAAGAGVIAEVAGSPGRWMFGHALVRESLYGSLSASRRVRVHWQLGEALADRGGSPIEVAGHLLAGVAAGDPRRAATACIDAVIEARRLAGFDAVVVYADHALELLRDLRPRELRLEYDATLAKADARYGMGDILVSVEVYKRAADLARELGDPIALSDAVVGFAGPVRMDPDDDVIRELNGALDAIGPEPSPQRVRLLAENIDGAVTWFGRAALRPVYDEMRTAANAIDDVAAKGTAARAELRYWHGSANVAALRDACARCLELSRRRADDNRYLSSRDAQAAHLDAAYLAALTGDLKDFDRWLAACAELGSRLGLVFAQWNAAVFRAAATIAEGRLADARIAVATARDIPPVPTGGFLAAYRAQMTTLRIAEGDIDRLIPRLAEFVEQTHPNLAVPHRAMLAGLLARAGDPDTAQRQLDTLAAAEFSDLPDDWLTPLTLRWAAEACARLRDAERAAKLEPIIRPYSGLLLIQAYAMTIEGAADRALAHVVAAQGRREEAAELYTSALDLETRMNFSGLAAETAAWRDELTRS